MTLFDALFIVLAGTGPYILVVTVVACLLAYWRTRIARWPVTIGVVGLILLMPWMIYILVRINNGL